MSSTNQQIGESTGAQPVPIGNAEAVNTISVPSHGYRGYCATIEQISSFLRTFSAEAGEDAPNSARSISFRERAHREGQCHSALNGKQPIFALLGYEDIRSLEGRLLTIMDASFTDREQRKAAKDLVRNAIWFDWVANLDMDGNGGKPDLRA
jgi:hypothetical protein